MIRHKSTEKRARQNTKIYHYNRAIKLDPAYTFAWILRGDLRLEMGETKLALDNYNRAIELDPTNTGAICKRSYIYHKLNKNQKALALGLSQRQHFT